MTDETELTHGTVTMVKLGEPTNPFEVEMLDAIEHAEQHLREGYGVAMQCGLNETCAKSTGVMIACQRVLASHLIQHCTSLLLPKEAAIGELKSVLLNLEHMIDEHYDTALLECVELQKKGTTQQ